MTSLALQLGLVLALFVVCVFAPGFFFLRRLAWSPMEKLAGSIGLSLIMLYLVAWEHYCLSLGTGARLFYGISAISVALGVVARKDLLRMLRASRVRGALLGFSFLVVWTLLILFMIRNYSGAGWFGDWLEHFQRTLFFLHHLPPDTTLLGGYQLPARPPMMNVLASFFLAQTEDRFEIFQVVFTLLNLLVYLPCCLILPALAGLRRGKVLPLAALFALSPVVMEAATYTWTKSLTAFFVVLALWFYLAGWRKKDRGRMLAAFLALSAGLLVHYSAGPYCAFIGLHYLLCVFSKRDQKWRELAIIATACLLLLLTWFGWSIATYGAHVTFASNTSVTSSAVHSGSNLKKIVANIYDSVVPRVFREPSSIHQWDQPNLARVVRDNAFIFYQTNVIFGMGLTSGPLVLGLLYGVFRHSHGRSVERLFWLAMIPFCVVVGIAVVGERDHWGAAHLTLLSLEVLGISMLVASFPLRRVAGVALIVGCIVDFSLGVFLHVRMENIVNSAQRTVLPVGVLPGLTFLGDHLENLWFCRLNSELLLLLFLGLIWTLWKRLSDKSLHDRRLRE